MSAQRSHSPPPPRRSTPWWVSAVLGGVLIVVGAILAFTVVQSVLVLAALVATGLIVAGFARLAAVSDSRSGGVDLILGLLLIGFGLLDLLWRDVTVPFLAVSIALALFATGVGGLVAAARGTRDERAAASVAGLIAVVLGILILVWPGLSPFVEAALFGAWLVFVGASRIAAAARQRREADVAARSNDRPPEHWGHLSAAFTALAVAALLLTGTVAVHENDRTVVPDGFFLPPGQVPSEAGQLIRSQPFTAGVGEGQQAWRILYTTTGVDGAAAVASGIVLAPRERDATPAPVLAVARGTLGLSPGCALSASSDGFTEGPQTAMKAMVDEGWVAVMSDYVGLGTPGPHPYLVGVAEAHNVLDALRAAHQLPGLELSDDTVVWGHSQGGHAALWTGLLAPQYAPEFDILGVAALAPAADLTALAVAARDGSFGKFVLAYMADSWTRIYPDLPAVDLVTPGDEAVVEKIGARCFNGPDADAAYALADGVSGPILQDSAYSGRFGELLRENTPSGRIAAPLLIAQGEADTIVTSDVQYQFAARWCAAGQPIDYRNFPGLEHVPLVEGDSPLTGQLVQWTRDRLAGKPPTPKC